MNLRLKTDFYAVNGYSVQTLNTVAMRTLQAPHHSTHENFPGIYLCSDALAGDGFESIQQGKMNVAIPSNVLEWITNDQPKFSFLHHESSTLTWHTLKDTSIRAFDIQIRDHRGRRFDSSASAELQSHVGLRNGWTRSSTQRSSSKSTIKKDGERLIRSGASDFNLIS